jgi:hypothetical protein
MGKPNAMATLEDAVASSAKNGMRILSQKGIRQQFLPASPVGKLTTRKAAHIALTVGK